MKLCFATNNAHKIGEVKALLEGQIVLVSLKDIGCFEELAETTGTINGNSRQKAEYVFKNYKVNCFADDSGLEVEALHGAPGVDSAHYAGPQRSHNDNIEMLLRNMTGIDNRAARFVTIITLCLDQKMYQFKGEVKGTILDAKKGSGGFGYDPVFMPDGFSVSLAEMTMEEKNKISHRAMAIGKLVKFINSQLES